MSNWNAYSIKFPKNHIRILLGDFSANIGKGDTSKPTIGNESYMKLIMIMELE
jgi:hypothetical protein